MNKWILLSVGFLFTLRGTAQNLSMDALLPRMNAAVTAIQEGSYTFHSSYKKVVAGEDSTHRTGKSNNYFKRLASDTLVGYQLASIGSSGGYDRVYDGNQLLSLYAWTKTVEITDQKFPKELRKLKGDYMLFPFFVFINRGVQSRVNGPGAQHLAIVGVEPILGEPCYKVQLSSPTMSAKGGGQSHYYISAKTFLPVRWCTVLEEITGTAHMIQTFDYSITNVQAHNIPDSVFTRHSLKGYVKEEMYDPARNTKTKELLTVGTIAPNWDLPTVQGSRLKLSDLKGEVVVMDFWYKECLPCLKQMVDLEELHKKFRNQKVRFVGINTVDDPVADNLVSFLKKREISMTSVYNGQTIQKAYNVTSSPALFVLDKEGKVIYQLAGYSNTLLKDLEGILSMQLKRE